MADNHKNNTKRIEIYDTFLRDGTQAQGVSLSGQDKLLIAEALDNLGVDYIEGGYPFSNPKDKAFFAEASKLIFKNARLAAFGMTRRKDTKAANDAGMQALLKSEAPVITIVGKSWDFHVREVLRTTGDENLAMIADSVSFLVKAGREVVFDAEHFFDGWLADANYALASLRVAFDAGASCLCMCDTNGGSTVAQIAETVKVVREQLPQARLGIHCHNDGDLAVANSIAAVLNGVIHVQGTINGIGERCGNADLISVVANLAFKHGYEVLRPQTLLKLTETSRLVYEVANLNFRDNQPFVGASAFAHKGGMHVHAVGRNTATYEHIDPAVVGNTRRILISELAGLSNVVAAASEKFNIGADKNMQHRVLDVLMKMENQGYQFEAAEASFEVLIRKTLGGRWYRKLWDFDHYRCVILRHDAEEASTEAIVKLRIDGQVKHTVAEGNGPVDSLHNSLCEALRSHYPVVDDLHLADYKVRVVNTAAETAAKVRVVIDWHDGSNQEYFGSVGVSENIIDASWRAIVDAIEYKVLREQDKK